LSDAVRAPPKHAGKVHGVRGEDLACCVLQVLEGDLFGMCACGELDVEAHEVAAFARDDDEVAGCAVDHAFAPDVGEGGERVDVHDAPDGVGCVAYHLVAKGSADSGVGAIAALDLQVRQSYCWYWSL
jgi:hypothetical protein